MTDKDIELITGFLENELTDPEIEEFKARYGYDEEFTREVNARSEIYISLEAASKVSLKNMVEKPVLRRIIDNRKPSGRATLHLNIKWVYRIAAVVIPLIALGIGIKLWVKPGLSADELYLTYWQKTQPKEEFRSFTGEQKGNFGLLQKEINNGILEALDKLSAPRDIHDFGLFCMEEGRFTEAIFAFKRAIGMNEKDYQESSEWNLGLCYLKSGDQKKARQVLGAIAGKPGHKFYQQSKEILRKIK